MAVITRCYSPDEDFLHYNAYEIQKDLTQQVLFKGFNIRNFTDETANFQALQFHSNIGNNQVTFGVY